MCICVCACVVCLCLPADSPPACLQMRAGSLMGLSKVHSCQIVSRKAPRATALLVCAHAGCAAGPLLCRMWQTRQTSCLCVCRVATSPCGSSPAVWLSGSSTPAWPSGRRTQRRRLHTKGRASRWVILGAQHAHHAVLGAVLQPAQSTEQRCSHRQTSASCTHVFGELNLKFAERPLRPCRLCMCRAPGVGDQDAAAAC